MQEEVFEIGLQGMSLAELSHRLAIPAHELLTKLFERGIAAQVNQVGFCPPFVPFQLLLMGMQLSGSSASLAWH